ncbi:TPA: DMSO/selenate family reductase complex B subunit [Escherichia coli]
MTTQYGFFIDSSRCTGCKTCELACKDFKDLGPEVSFRRIYEYAGGDWQEDNGVWHQNVFAYYLSISCNHCDDPACTKVCPSGAMHKREDGFVVVDEDVCIGCRYCHMACPYGAPQYNAEKGHMTKCDGCYSRVAEGKQPICVESCPLRALEFGPIEELRQKHGTLAAVAPLPRAHFTKPNIVIKPNANIFIGLAIGMLYGRSLGLWLPDGEEITLLLGLTGMATLLAATTHAPIMSTLMICEMTGEYQLLPGLLIACVIASVISRTLHRDSIYRQHTAKHS